MGSLALIQIFLLLTLTLARKSLESNVTVKRSFRRDMGDYNSYPNDVMNQFYEDESDKGCYFTPCCKAKVPGVVKECFIMAPLLSGVLSFAVISKLVSLGSTATGLCTSTTILMATTTGTIENLVTVTSSTTIISTTTVLVPVTSTILTTAVIVQTVDSLSRAPLIISTILITTSSIVRNTVSRIEIDKMICRNSGRKRALGELPPAIIDADEPATDDFAAVLPSVPITHQYHTEPIENGDGFVLVMYPKEADVIENSMGNVVESTVQFAHEELQTTFTPPLAH